MATLGKGFVLITCLALLICWPSASNSQQLVWQRQIQGCLDDTEMAFYHGGMDYCKPVFADLDGDGLGELYVGEHDGYLDVFENLGGNPPGWYCVTTALDSIDVGKHCAPAFWDIDNDNDLDLFLGNEEGRIWYFRNDGPPSSPAWTFQTSYWDSIDVGYHSIPFFEDLDADGDHDLLIANNSGGAAYFENYGTPGNPLFRFEAPFYQNIDLGMKSSVCVFDFNADNLEDLIMSSLNGHILYFQNEGPASNPSFRNMGTIADVPRNGVPTLWDLDGDGDLDLISGEADGNLNLWTNVGTPTNPMLQLATHQLAYFDAGLDSKPALADLDGDGDLDMLIGRHRWGMCYVENIGTPDSAAWNLIDVNYMGYNPGGTEIPTFCDLNNDGDQDMIIGLEDGTLTYIQNVGTPSVPSWAAPITNYANVDVGYAAAPVFADIDADSDLDLFIGCQLGTMRYVRNNGSPTNPIWQDLGNLPNMDVGYNSRPTFADLEGDGDLDLIIGSGNLQGWLTYYRNDGTPYLYYWSAPITQYQTWDFGDNASPCFGDLNDDGHPDLLVGCNAGGVWLMKNLGPLHDVDITLTPINPPIQLPASGGTFDFIITVEAGEAPFIGSLWCDVTMPGGIPFGPTIGPVTITIPADTSISRQRTQGVLGIADPGIYSMNGYVGIYPDSIWAEDSFTFEKLPYGDGPIVDQWFNIGESFEPWVVSSSPAVHSMLPEGFRLNQNRPNPFNPRTILSFELPVASLVRLGVYDISGRLLAELLDGWREAGSHEVTFDGSNLASGIYIYRLEAGELTASGKMVLMK